MLFFRSFEFLREMAAADGNKCDGLWRAKYELAIYVAMQMEL